jgi:hypothetical protein
MEIITGTRPKTVTIISAFTTLIKFIFYSCPSLQMHRSESAPGKNYSINSNAQCLHLRT